MIIVRVARIHPVNLAIDGIEIAEEFSLPTDIVNTIAIRHRVNFMLPSNLYDLHVEIPSLL